MYAIVKQLLCKRVRSRCVWPRVGNSCRHLWTGSIVEIPWLSEQVFFFSNGTLFRGFSYFVTDFYDFSGNLQLSKWEKCTFPTCYLLSLFYSGMLKLQLCSRIYYYYRYSAHGPVWAETRAQSVDWYSSGTLHPGDVLRGSLPLISPAFRRSHFRHQVPQRSERS